MLPLYMLLKCNIRSSSGILFQWINISTRLCSSSSSSSDSSDSDSDSEKIKPKTTHVKSASSASATSDNKYDLENFLKNMLQTRKTQKTIDVAMQPKKKKEISNKKHESFEKKIVNAAEDVANTLGGDKTKTTSDLLEKVLASRVRALKKKQESTKNVKQLPKYVQKNSQGQTKHLEKKSIIQNLLDEYKKQPIKKAIEDSISRKLLRSVTASKEMLQDTKRERMPRARFENIDLWNGKPTDIFKNMNAASPNIPELKTWAALEQRELKSLTTHPPANVFQELILWTEQGKLWKFPIDNEQGMEEEQNVHFSEHVFMERHLKEWCPKSGPIRHFMELVCTGLSKNPYLTVQEKIEHIMWYKEYFESKQDLLQEVGAIQQPISDKIKEITE